MKQESQDMEQEDYQKLVDKYLNDDQEPKDDEVQNKEEEEQEQEQEEHEVELNVQTQQEHEQIQQSITEEEYQREYKLKQWEKIQQLKIEYNQLFNENQFTKAKIINIENENYSYQRQIINWDIQNKVKIDGDNQLKIDSQTINKILRDNSFSVVKLKKEIQLMNQEKVKLDEQLEQYHQKSIQNIDNESIFDKLCKHYLDYVSSHENEEEQIHYLQKNYQKLKDRYSELQKVNEKLLIEQQEIHYQKSNNENLIRQLKKNLNKQEFENNEILKKIQTIQQELSPDNKKKQSKNPKKYQDNIDKDDIYMKKKAIEDNNKYIQQMSFDLQEQQRNNILLKQELVKQIQNEEEKRDKLQEKLINLKIYIQNQTDKNYELSNDCNTTIRKSIKSIK